MPVVLPERHTDRTEIEKAARAFQRRALKRGKAIGVHVAAIMRSAEEGLARDQILRGVKEHDWTLIRESLPTLALPTHVPLKKAKGTADPSDGLIESLTEAVTQSATYAVSSITGFDLVDANAVEFAKKRAGKFLTDLDKRSLQNARQAVGWGIEHGRTPMETADFLANTMYLPDRGALAVENYENGLLDRVAAGDSLADAARAEADGRALAQPWLDADDIEELVARYSDRWIDYAAETTARTMTIEASNEGLLDGWQQAAEAGYFDISTATLIWYATDDELTCPECEGLNDTECPADDPNFGDVDLPPAHPDCRCTVVLITPGGMEEEVA